MDAALGRYRYGDILLLTTLLNLGKGLRYRHGEFGSWYQTVPISFEEVSRNSSSKNRSTYKIDRCSPVKNNSVGKELQGLTFPCMRGISIRRSLGKKDVEHCIQSATYRTEVVQQQLRHHMCALQPRPV